MVHFTLSLCVAMGEHCNARCVLPATQHSLAITSPVGPGALPALQTGTLWPGLCSAFTVTSALGLLSLRHAITSVLRQHCISKVCLQGGAYYLQVWPKVWCYGASGTCSSGERAILVFTKQKSLPESGKQLGKCQHYVPAAGPTQFSFSFFLSTAIPGGTFLSLDVAEVWATAELMVTCTRDPGETFQTAIICLVLSPHQLSLEKCTFPGCHPRPACPLCYTCHTDALQLPVTSSPRSQDWGPVGVPGRGSSPSGFRLAEGRVLGRQRQRWDVGHLHGTEVGRWLC